MSPTERQIQVVWAWIAGLKQRGPASKDLAEELERLLAAAGSE